MPLQQRHFKKQKRFPPGHPKPYLAAELYASLVSDQHHLLSATSAIAGVQGQTLGAQGDNLG